MQSRLETLRRLASLYSAVEDMHSMELQRITASVVEARNAIGVELEVAQVARSKGREALLNGDCMNRISSETHLEVTALRKQRLEKIRAQREQLNDVAREQYVASRLKQQQIQRVFDDIAEGLEMEEGRRAQAVSDDRFLARRRWTDAQEQTRTEQIGR